MAGRKRGDDALVVRAGVSCAHLRVRGLFAIMTAYATGV